MILLPLLIWYSRRSEPIRFRDIQPGLAVVLMILILMPSEFSCSGCYAETPDGKQNVQLLREGTRIPPTTGRIVMLGRRWAFVPVEDPTGESVANHEAAVTRAFLLANVKARGARLGRSGNSTTPRRFHTAAAPMSEVTNAVPSAFQQVILQENLMLQRIVNAIRIDPTDDHWVVSGVITEFFDENRLSIQLAQRADRQ